MSRKSTSRFVAVFAAASLALASVAHATSYKVDEGHSGVSFQITHEQNKVYGIFAGMSGTVELTDEGGSIDVSLKAASINTGIAKRDEHLKGSDFFDVKQFPNITFKSSKVTKTADGYEATGTLSLHGVEKEVTIPLKVTAEAPGMMKGSTVRGVEGKITIKRSDFGIKAFIPVVGDEVDLMISLSAQKQ